MFRRNLPVFEIFGGIPTPEMTAQYEAMNSPAAEPANQAGDMESDHGISDHMIDDIIGTIQSMFESGQITDDPGVFEFYVDEHGRLHRM